MNTKQLSKRLDNVTYRQVDYWCNGALVPGVELAIGSGYTRNLTRFQELWIRMMAVLVNAGMKPADASHAVGLLMADKEWDLGEGISLRVDATVHSQAHKLAGSPGTS